MAQALLWLRLAPSNPYHLSHPKDLWKITPCSRLPPSYRRSSRGSCRSCIGAWLLAQKPWIVPVPGTTKLERLDENIGAVAAELTTNDLREIDSAASQITVQGARYPEELERRTGR